jgi:hypothetical protein
MAENNKIKVPGYAQRIFYNDGIEYRNFTPDLVGRRLVDDNNSALFTYGNFAVLKSNQIKVLTNYPTTAFGNYHTLNDISGGNQEVDSIFNSNVKIKLNIDASDINNFVYFGSATEFIRVTLESIITKWPASLFIKPLDNRTNNAIYSVENYTYNSIYKTSTFKIKNNTFTNNYDIVYNTGGELLINYDNELRSLISNYYDYSILHEGNEYPIIEFTGSTELYGDYVYLRVEGNPFPDALTNPIYEAYHIKPNKTKVEEFFAKLSLFENTLLNRLTVPKYKATFNYQYISDNGVIYNTSDDVIWPTSDGYNIDFNSNEYVDYVSKLLKITNSLDETKTDLMVRFLVSESISNFDTVPRCDGTEEETAGQKMTKTLRIYGREFDEIKQYIDGLAYANTITYNKLNNTPDQMVKYVARILGWDLTSSILENDLIKSYLDTPGPSYSGYSRGLTAAEAEIELWRRLILNSAWLFKSKGTRKAIEFLFKFIGAPEGLINLNEHIYVATKKVDIDLFNSVLEEYGYNTDFSNYNLDVNGYPIPFPNSADMYFQKGGLWYRETGGNNASIIKTTGNNPHIGPYDGGFEYINQFRNILPNFEPIIITSSTYNTIVVELFNNYNNGIINDYSGDTYSGVENWSGVSLDDCFLYESAIIKDPHPSAELTECGCDVPSEDLSLYIDIKRDEYTQTEQFNNCNNRITGYTYVDITDESYYYQPFIYNWNYLTYNIDGSIAPQFYTSPYISPTCCKTIVDGLSYIHDEYEINEETGKSTLINSGYICCKKPVVVTEPARPDAFVDFGFKSTNKKVEINFNPDLLDNLLTTNKTGCGCYISCKWRLAGPLVGDMYTNNNNVYLKFVTPKNNWGLYGSPEYRVTTESDSCFCPPNITTPEYIDDPYTNKKGYGCKLNNEGKALLTLSPNNENGTTNGQLYQFYYGKSNGDIACTLFFNF